MFFSISLIIIIVSQKNIYIVIYMNINFKNNYQIIFLVILSIIIAFQIYQLFNEDNKNEVVISSESSEIETYQETESISNKTLKKIHNIKETKLNVSNETTKLMKYGQPTNIFDENGSRIMFWKLNNNPWSNLYYNSTKNTFTFGLNATLDKDLLQKWTEVIPNIGFNEKENDVNITTEDEESALAVANLILSTIHKELTIKEIIDSNLLDISLAKIRAHPLVKTKILEQINEKLSNQKDNVKSDHSMDLATSKMNIDAYGGNEFSFLL
tara:strand:+ start:1048 stop:1854 length:807 start_codon:yes stop_codon:yes gene_type:complete